METRETIGICRSPNVVKVLNVHLENEEKIVKSSGAKMVVPYRKTFLDPLIISMIKIISLQSLLKCDT